MATTFSVSRSLPAPADAVFALLSDRDYVAHRTSLDDDLGGDLVAYVADGARIDLKTLSPFPTRWLPSHVSSRVGEPPALTRSESWVRAGDGSLSGEMEVHVSGVPAGGRGTMTVRDDGAGGSRYEVHMRVEVRMPLVGRALEGKIAPRIERSARTEADDLATRLATGPT